VRAGKVVGAPDEAPPVSGPSAMDALAGWVAGASRARGCARGWARTLASPFGETSDKGALRLIDTQTVEGDIAYLTYEVVREG